MLTNGSADQSSKDDSQQPDPSAIKSIPPIDFHLFPNLPMELQIKIFKGALGGPRIIRIEPYCVDGDSALRFRTLHPPSALLRACQISREVFISTHTTCITSNNSARIIRLDGALDTVFLHQSRRIYLRGLQGGRQRIFNNGTFDLNSVPRDCFSKVKHLVMALPKPFTRGILIECWAPLIASFSSLDSLIIYYGPSGMSRKPISEGIKFLSVEEFSSSVQTTEQFLRLDRPWKILADIFSAALRDLSASRDDFKETGFKMPRDISVKILSQTNRGSGRRGV
jgi:hypothetical protein